MYIVSQSIPNLIHSGLRLFSLKGTLTQEDPYDQCPVIEKDTGRPKDRMTSLTHLKNLNCFNYKGIYTQLKTTYNYMLSFQGMTH